MTIAEFKPWAPLVEPDISAILIGNKEENRVLSSLVEMVESQHFDDRKDGKHHLVHPLSVTHYVQRAKGPFIAQCAAVIHDYIEELVDRIAERVHLDFSEEHFGLFDSIESQYLMGLEEQLNVVFSSGEVSGANPINVTETTGLLTRHKRHRYFASIHGIYTCKDPIVREAGAITKVADRHHNGLTLETFELREAVYQCFKNIFILNEHKIYLRETGQLSDDLSDGLSELTPAEKIFRKCGKATDFALWQVAEKTREIANPVNTWAMEMASKKYILGEKGLEIVTRPNTDEEHLTRLYQGVIRKYDHNLHKDGTSYQERNDDEEAFCHDFFEGRLDRKQVKALVTWKDAISLKEVVVNLMYNRDYNIAGFGCSMCTRGHQCQIDLE